MKSHLTLLLAAGLLLASLSCGGTQVEETQLRPVRSMQVFASGSTRNRTFSGTARAGLESRLSFKVAGTVEAVQVNAGDRVRQGQLIARLDPTDYQLQVEDAQASLSRARAEARNAEANLERIRGLYENSNASQTELDGARTAFESASASVRSIEKRLELAQNQVSYTRLTAPVDGAIADLRVERNENVSAGQTVVVLSSGARPEVQISMPEALISQVRAGQPVTVRIAALDGREFPATVSEVAISSDGLATTYPVVARLNEDTQDVRPGMAAEVDFRFEVGSGQNRLVVPAYAVGEDSDGRFVWTVEGDSAGVGVVHRRGVRIGDITADGIEIVDGLQDGEHIVTAGVSRITDGQKVRFRDSPESAS